MPESLTADHAKFLLNEIFLLLLEREQPRTRQVIEAIPPTGGDYRPDAVSKTSLELAWHIVSAEKRFLEAVLNGQFNFDPITRPDLYCLLNSKLEVTNAGIAHRRSCKIPS